MAGEERFTHFKDQLNVLGTHHDAQLQGELQKFCMKIDQTPESEHMVSWLDAKYSRPLWQLGIIAMMANKGIVMMIYGQHHDAELLCLDSLAEEAPEPEQGTDPLPDASAEGAAESEPGSVGTGQTEEQAVEEEAVPGTTPAQPAQSAQLAQIQSMAAQSPYEPLLIPEATSNTLFEDELASLSLN